MIHKHMGGREAGLLVAVPGALVGGPGLLGGGAVGAVPPGRRSNFGTGLLVPVVAGGTGAPSAGLGVAGVSSGFSWAAPRSNGA